MFENLSREEIYTYWAPRLCVWSPWVKPVLFSFMPGNPLAEATIVEPMDWSWLPQAGSGVAIVLDLPRERGVVGGLELAARGYRPVPLYNALPGPTEHELVEVADEFRLVLEVVEVTPILEALVRGTRALSQCRLADDAPPVFMLDANRRVGVRAATIGSFDNRSVSFTTDFPSAIFLRQHGISRMVLCQQAGAQPQPDLAHTLRRWQEGGLKIELKQLSLPGLPEPLVLEKVSWFSALWYRLTAAMGLRRHYLGGFGGIIGMPGGG